MNRRAVTLVEMLLVVTLLGVLLGLVGPPLADTIDRATLRSAQVELLGALDAARGAAVRLGEPVNLAASATQVSVAASHDTSAIVRRNLAPYQPLGLAGFGAPIRFGPAGITLGAANRTLRLSAGQDTLRVVLSRLGRIR